MFVYERACAYEYPTAVGTERSGAISAFFFFVAIMSSASFVVYLGRHHTAVAVSFRL